MLVLSGRSAWGVATDPEVMASTPSANTAGSADGVGSGSGASLAGSQMNATAAPARTNSVPIREVTFMAWTNERLASRVSCARAAPPGNELAATTTLPMPSRTVDPAATDSVLKLAVACTLDRYTALVMLPRIATPRAPPIWRVVSLTADPTPALASGSEPMIELVAGVITMPSPVPSRARTAATSQYDESARA